MVVDFGELGPTDRILLERAGFLLARSERLHDADVAMRMSAEARRIIASLRKRVPTSSRSRDMPSLRDRWSDEDALAAHGRSDGGTEPF